MLDTSILGELTADACAAVTARQDAVALLRRIDTASLLFLVALDDEQDELLRYHHLVRGVLRAELRARTGTASRSVLLLRGGASRMVRAHRRHMARRPAFPGRPPGLAGPLDLLLQDRPVVTGFLASTLRFPAALDLSTVELFTARRLRPTGCWA